MKRGLPLIVLLLAVAGPPAATAGTKNRKAIAAELFERGIKDMQAGKIAQGCDELAESVATIPDSGAKGALAECNTALGRLSDAWDLWRDLASSAPTEDLRSDATKNAAGLERRLARVTMHIRGAAPDDLVVTLNGKPASARAVTEYHVDPGTLVVVATSPETKRWTHSFKADEGMAIDIEIPLAPSEDLLRRRQLRRVVGLSLIGAGVVALAVGSVSGGIAYSDWGSANDSCGGDTNHCKTQGFVSAQRDLDSARSAAKVATWSSGVGGILAVAGLAVYVSLRGGAPSAEAATAWRASPLASSQTVGIVLSRSLP